MNTDQLLRLLDGLDACDDAQEWTNEQRDARAAWTSCERADWMLWLARKLNIDHKTRVRVACACARTALKYVPEGEDRPRKAIEVTERWCDDAASLAEVLEARNAAYAAYAAAAAAYAYAYAAAADAADAARSKALAEMADLVRQYITFEELTEAAKDRI